MPVFERHFATEVAETAKLPRANVSELADTGQVLEAQALEQFGADLTETSAVLFKWREREGNSEYDTLRGLYASRMGEEKRTNYADSAALKVGTKKLEADLAKLPSKNSDEREYKNEVGIRKFKAFLDLNKAKRESLMAEKEIRMIDVSRLTAYLNNMIKVAESYTNKDDAIEQLQTLTQGAFDDKLRTESQIATDYTKGLENWVAADLNRRSQTVIRPSDGEVDQTARVDWLNQPENIEGIDPDIVKVALSDAEKQKTNQQRRDAIALEEKQDDTSRQMLIDLWDENLTEEKIAEAVSPEKKWITTEQAKYLRTALNSTQPRKTDFMKLAEVKDARLDVGLGRITREQALSVLYKNITDLSDADAKTELNAIYAATLKDDNYWISESRSYMEEQIREKDPLTGMFTDNAAEQALSAQSKLILDKTIEDAAKEKKPLSGRDILIKAHELMIPLRQEAAELRKKKAVPETIGEGLGEAPFITEADLDRAEEQARKTLGEGASNQDIKTEMLRLLGE